MTKISTVHKGTTWGHMPPTGGGKNTASVTSGYKTHDLGRIMRKLDKVKSRDTL